MDVRRIFGELVRIQRTRQLLTQEVLAALAFDNPDRKSYVSNVENNRLKGLTPETARKLADVLGIARGDVPVSS
jgi:transcriptional regulator with XRE-family HTH domain